MSNYTDNNILFNNVKDISVPVSGAVGVRGAQGVDPEWGGVINAVDIDWNDAQLDNTTISTTGELLHYIYSNISELSSKYNTLSGRISDIDRELITLNSKIDNISGGSLKPTAELVGAIEHSTYSYYDNYSLIKVKVQTNNSGWPVTVTNNNSGVALIDNAYFNYIGSVTDRPTNPFTTIQLNNFDEYITIVPSNSGAITTTPTLTFSTSENSIYADTFTVLDYSFNHM